jgi:hypothetical protein
MAFKEFKIIVSIVVLIAGSEETPQSRVSPRIASTLYQLPPSPSRQLEGEQVLELRTGADGGGTVPDGAAEGVGAEPAAAEGLTDTAAAVVVVG